MFYGDLADKKYLLMIIAMQYVPLCFWIYVILMSSKLL